MRRHHLGPTEFRLLRQHGMSVPDRVRHGSAEVIFEDYPVLGYNYRMTDIQAAIGRVQLKRLQEVAGRELYVSVNVSPRQFRSDQFLGLMRVSEFLVMRPA